MVARRRYWNKVADGRLTRNGLCGAACGVRLGGPAATRHDGVRVRMSQAPLVSSPPHIFIRCRHCLATAVDTGAAVGVSIPREPHPLHRPSLGCAAWAQWSALPASKVLKRLAARSSRHTIAESGRRRQRSGAQRICRVEGGGGLAGHLTPRPRASRVISRTARQELSRTRGSFIHSRHSLSRIDSFNAVLSSRITDPDA